MSKFNSDPISLYAKPKSRLSFRTRSLPKINTSHIIMDDQDDPGLQFYPDGNVDLYGTLGVAKAATSDEIKKAYKR